MGGNGEEQESAAVYEDSEELDSDQEESYEYIPPRRRSGWKVFRRVMAVLLILFCLIAGTLCGVALYVTNGLAPVDASEQATRIEIPKGMKSTAIGQLLKDEGLIRNNTIFKYYLWYKREGSRFQAGKYDITPGTSLDDIIVKLNNGDTVPVEMVKFTIPEGYTASQIADLLGKGRLDGGRDVLASLQNTAGLDSEHFADIPDDPQILFKLEGYLFPETYEMVKESTAKDIINRMLKELDNKLETLPGGWQQRIEESGMTFHQILTIASLVEREVVVKEERPVIAGIIYNRLNKKMPLQIDATIQYILPEQKETLLFEDLEIVSPYNTYLNPGLPPGPIANPSISAIKAAIYPEETKFLYYVTKKDGTNTHLFAETFKKHQANIKASNNP